MMNIGFRAEQIFEKTPIKILSNVKKTNSKQLYIE